MAEITQLIADTASRYGVDPALAIEVAAAESGMNPDTPDSPKGAVGLFQLMPATAASFGVNPRDVQQNIQGGVMLLQQLLSHFGDVSEALAAYNWNPAGVTAAMASYGADWLSHAPGETQNYVAKILGNLGTQYQVASSGLDSSSSFHAGIQADGSGANFSSILTWAVIGFFALWLLEEAL